MQKSLHKGIKIIMPIAAIALAVAVSVSQVAYAATSFTDYFSSTWRLEEAPDMSSSTSSNWYLNSGGRVYTDGSRLKSIQGSLPANDYWRLAYAAANARDTDNGYHPQNLLRLLTRTKWQNSDQKIYAVINKYNLSASPERYNPNGILLFSHYVDSNNLYYAGVRVDGDVVIKKKVGGRYYTLAEKKYFAGTYDRNTNPNLLPVNKWIGVRTRTTTLADGSVNIKLYVDRGWTGVWTLALDKTDNNSTYGPAVKAAGYNGLRTDFMDITADQYSTVSL